jgi:hypothetical protein
MIGHAHQGRADVEESGGAAPLSDANAHNEKTRLMTHTMLRIALIRFMRSVYLLSWSIMAMRQSRRGI